MVEQRNSLRVLGAIVVFAIVAAAVISPGPGAATARRGASLPGDVNCNGTVSSIDAAFVLQYGAGLLASLRCEDSADVNSDGTITSIDAVLILQFTAGLLTGIGSPGVTDTEIILGAHTPLTGPAFLYAAISQATKAYFDYINDTEGGIYGREIVYLLEDDQFSPPSTVEVVQDLVEKQNVFAIVGGIGTPGHLQVVDYLQERGVPDLYVATSATDWVAAPEARPSLFGSLPNDMGESIAVGRYIAEAFPGMKLGIAYQDDDFGHDGLNGLRIGIGSSLEIVGEERIAFDPNIESQINRLEGVGADVIAVWALPRMVASGIEHARIDLESDIPFFIAGASTTEFTLALTNGLAGTIVTDGVFGPVAFRQAHEIEHPGMARHIQIMNDYGDIPDPGNLTSVPSYHTVLGQYIGELTVETLRLAGPDLTRAGLLRAAESIREFQCSVCLFAANMSPSDHDPAQSIMMARAVDDRWVPFGDVITWESVLPGDLSADSLETLPSPYGAVVNLPP